MQLICHQHIALNDPETDTVKAGSNKINLLRAGQFLSFWRKYRINVSPGKHDESEGILRNGSLGSAGGGTNKLRTSR
jgi:hypothetical protein